LCSSDLSIPQLDALTNEKEREDLEKMKSFIESTMVHERQVTQEAKRTRETTAFPDPSTECKPPQ
jgi:hypothetical protein